MTDSPALPCPIRPGPRRWWLHGVSASRALEATAAARLPAQALMQRAGLAVARLAAALAPHARRIEVLAGPGNNGGDGWVAATELHRQGRAVRVRADAGDSRLPADAEWARQWALAAGVPHAPQLTDIAGDAPDLVIDAMLGLGTTRPTKGALAEAIAWINAQRCPVLAVDLPSGLHAGTGQPLGTAVRATHTLALLTLKPGLFTAQGRDHAGMVWFDDLGVEAGAGDAAASLPSWSDLHAAWPHRPHATHKGSFGDVWIVGGQAGMTGAAWLAGHAAATAGAGRVYCSLLAGQESGPPPGHLELMTRAAAWTTEPTILREITMLVGCGGGQAVQPVLAPLLAHAGRLVLDADALNAIAAEPPLQALLRARGARGRPAVITPHPLEAARLLGCPVAEVQSDRLAAAIELSQRLDCVTLLKGSGTVIAAPGELPSLNPSGNALLASPGTGDVLAGWLAGTWSALGKDSPHGARTAAIASAWLHGHAADLAFQGGRRLPLLAGELVQAMRQAMGSVCADRAVGQD